MTTRRPIFKTFAAAICAAAVEVTGLQPIPRFRSVFEAAYSATTPRMLDTIKGGLEPFPANMGETRFNLSDDDTWQLASTPPDDCQPNPDYYTP